MFHRLIFVFIVCLIQDAGSGEIVEVTVSVSRPLAVWSVRFVD